MLLDHGDNLVEILFELQLVADVEAIEQIVDEALTVTVLVEIDRIDEDTL